MLKRTSEFQQIDKLAIPYLTLLYLFLPRANQSPHHHQGSETYGDLKEMLVNAEQSERKEEIQQQMAATRKPALPLPSSRVSSQAVLSDLFNVPYEKMYAADLTPMDLALFTGTTSAKVDIVLELAKHEPFCYRANHFPLVKIVEWQPKVGQMNSFRSHLENGRAANTEIGQQMQNILKPTENWKKL